jgi:hypothetical protein
LQFITNWYFAACLTFLCTDNKITLLVFLSVI